MKTLWGGFIDGNLDVREIDTGWGGWGQGFIRMPMVFTTRAEARRQYEDVRKVEVKPERRR